jgi:hypothetical protein
VAWKDSGFLSRRLSLKAVRIYSISLSRGFISGVTVSFEEFYMIADVLFLDCWLNIEQQWGFAAVLKQLF